MPAHVEIGAVMGAGAPVYAPVPFHAQTLTTASSAQTTVAARSGDYATVTAVTSAVMVAIGANPTALATGAGMYRCEPGSERTFGPLKAGDRIAAIDAA
jgi:hypothetical protein